MIAQRRVETDAGLEQRSIRPFELVDEIIRVLPTVEVVAEHDHELERKRRAGRSHLLADVELRLRAAAVVADDGKLQRVGLSGRIVRPAGPSSSWW